MNDETSFVLTCILALALIAWLIFLSVYFSGAV